MLLPLPTVIDLKAQLNYDPTDTTDDGELTGFLAASVGLVETMVGPLSARTVTETHYSVSTDLLVLRQSPATAISSVTVRLYPGMTATPYLAADVLLDPEYGFLRWANGRRWQGDITVTYTAGRDTVPSPIALGVLIIAAHLWETQRGNGPSAGPLQPDLAPSVPMGFAIPNRAATLIEPYRQVRVA